jgi:5-methylcytosine-specific restriction endonuclease McrA
MVLIEEAKQAEREQRQAARREAKREAQRSKFEWRTERQCPGCACWFTPLYTPNSICCSQRCVRRVHRWRRSAAERKATGSFTWSQFMSIARRFGYSCAYCGDKPGQLDPEHVVPLSRGGHNSTTNLLPSCRQCNADKRDLMLDEWALDREARGKPPRRTTWAPDDKRYWHLTQEALRTPSAA